MRHHHRTSQLVSGSRLVHFSVMMASFKLSLVVLLVAFVGLVVADTVDIDNPVRSADEDEVKELPGLSRALDFKHYSGYLEADGKNPSNHFWHYWFTESATPDEHPLVLWLNGGPGCSSVLGLLTELGPFRVDGTSIIDNPYAWNKVANVLFLESPAGVGFSYSSKGDEKADDDTTAFQNYQALKSFFKKFPQYKNRPLYLTGESYGGVYLPTLAVLVDQDPEMNLKGVAIGNGYLHATKLAVSQLLFDYYHGLIGLGDWQRLGKACCDSRECSRTTWKMPMSTACTQEVVSIDARISALRLNLYNIYDKCQGNGLSKNLTLEANYSSRETFDLSLVRHGIDNLISESKKLSRKRMPSGRKFKLSKGLTSDPPCTDDSVIINYLNREDVKTALHIPDGLKRYDSCFDGIDYTMIYAIQEDGMLPQMRKLIRSPRKLNLLIYNGDIDYMCNFIGDEWFSEDLNLKLISDYQGWHVEGQLAGFVKHYEGLTFATVRGSGHMVPTDKAKEAFHMFYTYLNGHKDGELEFH